MFLSFCAEEIQRGRRPNRIRSKRFNPISVARRLLKFYETFKTVFGCVFLVVRCLRVFQSRERNESTGWKVSHVRRINMGHRDEDKKYASAIIR